MPASDADSSRDESHPQLPSFYSPRTSAADATGNATAHAEVDSFSLSKGAHAQAHDTQSKTLGTPPQTQAPQTHAQTPGTDPRLASLPQLQQPSPLPSLPSLVSPSFTPPSATTPAPTSVPATSAPSAPPAKEPRGVPVDSSVPSGGCGNKKPRLLETLPHVECIVRARIPTVSGTQMFLHLYTNNIDKKEHLAIVFGDHIRSKSLDAPRPGETERDRMTRGAYTGVLFPGRTTSGEIPTDTPIEDTTPLVRVHSECYTGETVWSARCDCGEQLDEAARLMALPSNKAGGIIIYLRQEGRGIGLGEKLKAYNLQDLGSDTVEANLLLRHPADARSYGLATAMLADLGQSEIRLLTNNPDKIRAVEGPNREVVVKERVPMVPLSWLGEGGFRSREVDGYLSTKVSSLRCPHLHLLFLSPSFLLPFSVIPPSLLPPSRLCTC